MSFPLILLSLTIGALLGNPVMAASEQLSCSGPFARDASHEGLVKEFGTRNVTYRTINGPEGEKLKASIIYPNDDQRRVEVIWWDEKGRRRPSTIRTSGKGWVAPRDLRVGMSAADVEAANGRSFEVSGFGWDYGGTVTDWKGGALASMAGGCTLLVIFDHDERAPEKELMAVTGDRQFLSSNRNFRAVKATIRQVSIGYPDGRP
ncbi:MAG TPA: hypothetical protein VHL98_22245 [Microvirga sp.]|jgi:hypothetical protein|nr:hypothetical protein [Microvirga sp.]